ncbi:eCIS core domain-containing protein [Gynuella sp.]|uniref:eCIS core domain-containing protein n=1 Tax=Gynuella sp. TaxID=2969146 RepID=UPI003D10EE52
METAKKSSTSRKNQAAAQTQSPAMDSAQGLSRTRLQMASKVSSPDDPQEKEADHTAQKIMRMAIADSSISYVRQGNRSVFRQIKEKESETVSTKLKSPYIARFTSPQINRTEQQPPIQTKTTDETTTLRSKNTDEQVDIKRLSLQQDTHLKSQANSTLQRQATKEPEAIQTKPDEETPDVQRKAASLQQDTHLKSQVNSTLQRQATKEPEAIQTKPDEETPDVQRKAASDLVTGHPQQQQDTHFQTKPDEETSVQRSANSEEPVQAKAEGTPDVSGSVSAQIRSSMTGGEPLPLSVRKFMEPRFNADFSNVRVHKDGEAAKLNTQVNAKAFAVHNHIFFGKDQYQPDSDDGKELMAHELTHTIQQGGAVQRSADEERPDVPVEARSETKINRLGISDALDYFADKAYLIPGFRMFTIILGMNPINRDRVERSAANILRAIVEFLPGGILITRALDNHGIFERVGHWVEQQINGLGMTWTLIRDALDRFLDSLSWRDIFDLSGVWARAKRIFTDPINRIKRFVSGIFNTILQFIRDAVLRPLAERVARTRGWDLLTALLGSNPITGDPVPRNAETLIGGFMKLIGQEEVWNNIKRANAIARAWAWFQGAMAGLLGFVRQIPTLFMNVFRALQIRDLLDIPSVLGRVFRVFGNFVGRFISWAGGTVLQLLQIIFEVVAPGAMPYLRRAAAAFRNIIRNPIGFIGNLVRAGKLGFQKFRRNFMRHLRTSLINWLTGTMSGADVYIPQAFTLREILKFVLSVLGLTWQNIRTRLVRVVGERAVTAMEAGFDLIRTLITEGPAAAWRQLLEGLSNLRDMVIEQIITFVTQNIVTQAVIKLVSMLNPVGAFVQAIIATYNTIMFFVERLRTIARVAMSFINSISAIAAGRLNAAANRVETTMAGMLTLVISFLARFAGLGRVSTAVRNIIDRVRRPINRGIDRVVNWIVAQARRAGRFIVQAGVPQDPEQRARQGMAAAVAVVNRLPGNRIGEAVIRPALRAIKARYGFSLLEPLLEGGVWWVIGEMSPRRRQPTQKSSPNAPTGASTSTLPDRVDILNSGGATMISGYSRSSRSGSFQTAIFSGSVTLSKLKHPPQAGQTGDQIVNAPSTATVEYTISAANGIYGTPPTAFQAVDRSDPDEAASYSATREAFPEVMRNWWQTEPTADAARIAQLNSAGLVDIDATGGLIRGQQKWRYIHSQLNAQEQAMLTGPVNKDNMVALLDKLPASRRDILKQAWKNRWARGTQIHHIKPVNFGGNNSNFVPLSADKHIGSNGVHPRFWTPLKRFLMNLRS